MKLKFWKDYILNILTMVAIYYALKIAYKIGKGCFDLIIDLVTNSIALYAIFAILAVCLFLYVLVSVGCVIWMTSSIKKMINKKPTGELEDNLKVLVDLLSILSWKWFMAVVCVIAFITWIVWF